MDIVAKFGQMGNGLGQFHSPHGFCLSPTEDIVVADTHNHRIQVIIIKYYCYSILLFKIKCLGIRERWYI